jgi:hypothetical protein
MRVATASIGASWTTTTTTTGTIVTTTAFHNLFIL